MMMMMMMGIGALNSYQKPCITRVATVIFFAQSTQPHPRVYCHPLTYCFVVSQLFSVARHVRRSKPRYIK